jgi:hypothetical protein
VEVDPSNPQTGADTSATGARRSIWRHRGRRLATGLNVLVAVGLAVTAVVLVNLLSSHFFRRWDISQTGRYRLSARSLALVRSLGAPVAVTVFMQRNQPLYDEVRNLLEEYRYAAGFVSPSRLKLEYMDPDRDLARSRDLAARLDIRQPNTIVFEAGGRRKFVEAKDLVEVEYALRDGATVDKKITAFRAEEVFSSAILNVSEAAVPVVYLLTGHGEHDALDYTEPLGYSSIARIVRRDNIELKPLRLDQRGIPQDAAAVVVAGPERRLAVPELDLIRGYLGRGGRVLALLDPGAHTGLEAVLADWGVKLSPDVVVGLTLTGRELLISDYGDHPITRHLNRAATLFYRPRSVEAAVAGTGADKPLVTPLALTTTEGWAENDLKQQPPKFDAATDRRGPIPVAVAVTKGSGDNVALRPTRLVVVGDSVWVGNGALAAGSGANADLFMNALNWLIERDTVLAIGPRRPQVWSLDLDRSQLRLVYGLVVGAIPGLFAVLGALVWLRRRR